MAGRYATTDLMRRHASVREYTDEPVSGADIEAVMEAVRAASTSCTLQVTSVVRVTDPALRKRLAALSGNQAHVEKAPEFWIFCVDYNRDDRLLADCADLGWAEQLLVGCTDAAIMAQSAMTAAESLGLGCCFIGGLRNGIEEVDAVLGLPRYAFPLLGITFGHPRFSNELKPRLPLGVLFSENAYRSATDSEMEEYNEVLRAYYRTRERGAKDSDWRETVHEVLIGERRKHILPFLHKKGFALK